MSLTITPHKPKAKKPVIKVWCKLGASLLALICTMSTGLVHGAWQLDNQLSSLNFISTKATHIAETHTFDTLAGTISDSGEASITIDLTSVNTGIAIRDERMQSMLFNVADFPKAKITATVDLQSINNGTSTYLPIVGTLSLAGASTSVAGEVLVIPDGADAVTVTTVTPVIIKASSLSLEPGIEALRNVAGLPSIGYSVPVTFSLTFKR